MQELVGKKVWVIQFDDGDDAAFGTVESIGDRFIALRFEGDDSASLYINLKNVKEIEVFRPSGEGEVRHLRVLRREDA